MESSHTGNAGAVHRFSGQINPVWARGLPPHSTMTPRGGKQFQTGASNIDSAFRGLSFGLLSAAP